MNLKLKRKMKKISLILFCLIAVSACSSSVKRTLGLSKTSPDEYAVLRQPPLSMPPSDYLLPPADQGKQVSNQVQDETAEEILLGKGAKKASTQSLSSSDRSFIGMTNDIAKRSDIKEEITKDAEAKAKTSSKKAALAKVEKPVKPATEELEKK